MATTGHNSPEAVSPADGAHPVDPVEAALAGALEAATKAGQWAVVAQLAGQLDARRLARADVPTLADARARRERGR